MKTITGTVHHYGDQINTDVIIPTRFQDSYEKEYLGRYCLYHLDPTFAQRCKPGDILVAGVNFGCGSSREMAPVAILGAGVSCVIAASFARIFFRNALNIGLPVIESPEIAAACQSGDRLSIDFSQGMCRNLTSGQEHPIAPLPTALQALVDAGGLMPYLRQRLGAR